MTILIFSSKIGEKNLLHSTKSENNFTDYRFVLRLIFFVFITLLISNKTFSQSQLISTNDGGFENGTKTFPANGWTVVNDNTNKWYVGTATKGAGTNGAYIDNNSGTSNKYTITSNNTSHFYRDIIIPTGATNITLSFLLKGSGELSYDRLLVYTAPNTVNPVAGTPAEWTTTFSGATLIYSQTSFYSSYTSQSVVLPNSLAGTTVRLIFTWQNDDNTGTNPPAAVDNISLVYTPCTSPSLTYSTTNSCVGGSTGTITGTGSGGSTPYSYSIDGSTYQSGNNFSGLSAGNYTLYIKSNTGCITSTSVTISEYGTSSDDPFAAGTNTWIGHAYKGTNFDNYIGYFTEGESFNEGFGGNTTCFPVTSSSGPSSLYTEQFSVAFKMNSTRHGLYVVDLGSDDGSRLTIDGSLIYNNWSDQAFTTKPAVLINLTGSSSLNYEYYENGGGNQCVFQNLTAILSNTLSTNITQNLCLGNAGLAISGDVYGTLPTGISKSGTGYQWTYSTTPTGSRTNISGATSATYTPNTSTAPFNAAGTFYIYRNTIVSSTNNVSPNPYIATNESNAATIIVSSVAAPTASVTSQPTCTVSTGTITVSAPTGAGITYSKDGTNYLSSATFTSVTTGSYNVNAKNSNGCISSATNVVVNAQPAIPVAPSASVTAQPSCATSTGTISITAPTGAGISYSLDGVTYTNTTGIFPSVASGTYSATAKNSSGCISSSTNVTVNAQPLPIGNNQLDYINGAHGTLCATPPENGTATLAAPAGTVFTTVTFASYGTPNGSCSSFTINTSCNATTSQSIAEGYLLGNGGTIGIPANNSIFTDPCYGTSKRLYIQATYTQPVCSGTSPGTITGSIPSGGTGAFTYYWEQSTTSSSTGFGPALGTNNTINYSPGNLTQTTWYRRTVTSGCTSVSAVIQVTVNALPATPTISATGSTSICSGGSVTLTSSAGSSYLWSTGATTQSISATASGSYTVKVTNASGCQSVSSSATAVTVNALPATPTISAGGSTTFCAGGSVTLNSSAGTNYLWSTGATTQSISATTSGSYTVQVTNASGCQSASSSATVVTVNALPTTPTISAGGSTTFCAGGSVTLTSSAGTSYLWSTGATTQSISPTTSGSYTVQVTNASGCQSASSSATVVTVNALPTTPTISAGGSTTFCAGGSVTLTSSASTSYLWSTGATTQSISATTSGNYTVQVTNASGCQSASSSATAVTVTTMPSATISYAGTPYCSSAGAATVTLTGTTGGSFTSDANLVIDASTGTINLGTSTAGSHTITYKIAASGGCAQFSTTTTITITTQPYATGFYPNTPYCSNIGTLVPTGSYNGLLGTLSASPSGLSINSSTGVINVSASTPGSYTVYYNVPASGGCGAYSANAPLVISTAPSSTINYPGSPYCFGTGTATVTQTGTSGGVYSSTSGLVIDANSGAINLNTSTPNTYIVSYTIAASNGCSQYVKTCSITINAKVSSLAFASGSSSARCQGAGTVTYGATASNSTGIVYSLDATSLTAGNTINSTTGTVTYVAGYSGTSVITAVANGCTPLTTTHSATTNATPSVSASTTLTCVGGSTGTITATGTGGSTPYTFNLNSGSYQSGTLFANLAVGTYTLGIKSAAGCTSSTSVTISTYPTSSDDQTASATNTWIGHTYSGSNFQNYIGHFTEPETFNESFGGSTTCFGLTSGATFPSIYTDNFSVRFRMNSTRIGLYVVDLGSDDGSRLYIDGTLVYNNWTPQSFVIRPRVLMSLNGNNSLAFEYFENTGANTVAFQNITLVLANSLSTNATQSICMGNSGSTISGDTYGTLPSGISLSGTGYQWSYSLTTAGARTNISGATGATFTPNSSTAPFNAPGTYYVYRNAILSSSNNTGINPYVASNESNAAVITVAAVPSASVSYINTPFCNSSSLPESVTLSGTPGGAFSSPGLIINASTGAITPNQNAVGYYTVTYTIPATGGCLSFATSTPVYIGTPGTWSGKIDTSWDNAGNWICGQIPSSTIDATIPKMVANFPTVLSNTSEAKDVNIKSGASLVIIGTIKIAGNINNSGNFNVSNGTVEMEGSNAQSLAGSMFDNKTIKNLVINNTGSGVTVSSTANDTLKVTGLLSFGNASAILNTGDNITLVSNSAGTAAVGVVGGANSINGNVIVERYINTGTATGDHPKSWQFLATPTTGQSIKQSWMENGTAANYYGTMISGPAGTAAGFDISSPAASMKYYNYVTNGWTGVANAGDPVVNSKGYMVFVRGDRTVTGATQAANPTVLRTKGTLNTGTLASIIVHNNKYESIGNPYAAPIDFTLLSKDAGIDDKYYTWDPYLYGSYGTGGYQTITAVNNWKPVPGGTTAYPSSVVNSTIQSGQAFFVHATSADSTGTSNVNFMENCKSVSNTSNKFSRMEGTIINTKRQFLRASLITSSGLMADGNVVAFDKTFSSGIDGNDAIKMLNSGENFTVKAGGQLLAVEATSPVVSSDTIYYYTSNLAKTTYKLIFAPENMQSANVQAFLVDKFLSTETPVSLTDSTFINVTVTSAAASSAPDRFMIVFRQLAALPVTVTSVTANLKNKDIVVNWNVQNESGIQQYQVEKSTDGIQFNQASSVAAKNSVTGSYSWTDLNVADGTYYYRIKIITVDGKTSYTQIVKVISGKSLDQISVYPNPVKAGVIHLQLTNQPGGNYGVRLFNSAGQLIVSKKITHAKGTSEETIICPNLAKGIYQLEIVKTDGSVEVIKVMN